MDKIPAITPRCFVCLKNEDGWNTCPECLSNFPISRVIIAKEYTPVSKALVWKLKNDGLQEAARIMAKQMAAMTQNMVINDYIIVPAPTSNRRKRQRGYDQAYLIAKELQKITGNPFANILRRKGDIHQVGSDIKTRKQQLHNSFEVIKPNKIRNAQILLVDDVITTGSTLAEAAKMLITHGAKEVSGICFAHPKLRHTLLDN